MKYPALFLEAPEGGYTVTFRDIPEAFTEGDTIKEARDMAADALLAAMDFYFEDGRRVPAPSKAEQGEELITLPLSAAAKVELLNLRIEKNVRPADLARAMGIKPQEMTRILDLHHSTKIDTLAAAFSALGRSLNISTESGSGYVLIPSADGLGMEELEVAKAVFRAYIDARLGGTTRAEKCFGLWIQRGQGHFLSDEELLAAQSWHDAERMARELASLAVSPSGKVDFLVRRP